MGRARRSAAHPGRTQGKEMQEMFASAFGVYSFLCGVEVWANVLFSPPELCWCLVYRFLIGG
jgi:hypothetical protein